MRPRHHRSLVVALAVIALLISLVTPVAAADGIGKPKPGADALARNSWIVTLRAGVDAGDAAGLARAAGGRAGHVFEHALNGFQFKGSAAAAAALERNPRVASVEPDGVLHLTETLPYGVKRVFAYRQSGQTGAYQAGFRGNGARVAILDTGIDLDHPELAASIDHGLGKNCITDGAPPNDGYGHGSHVAGIVAAPDQRRRRCGRRTAGPAGRGEDVHRHRHVVRGGRAVRDRLHRRAQHRRRLGQ